MSSFRNTQGAGVKHYDWDNMKTFKNGSRKSVCKNERKKRGVGAGEGTGVGSKSKQANTNTNTHTQAHFSC